MSYRFEWKNSNGQDYLYMEADTHYELGVAYGQGNAKLLTLLWEGLQKRQGMQAPESPAAKMAKESVCKGFMDCIPENYMEEIRGICDGYEKESGIRIPLTQMASRSFQIDMTNRLMAMHADKMSPDGIINSRGRKAAHNPALDGCTDLACINTDGTVVHGQNYDGSPGSEKHTVFVHQKLKGHPEVFLYRPAGTLGMPCGKNELGVCLTVSIVHTRIPGPIMTPRSILVRNAMEQSSARKCLEAMTENGKSPFSYNLIASDAATAVGAQTIPEEQRISCVKDCLAQTNLFDYVDWQKHLIYPSFSKKRQFYAEGQLLSYRSRFGRITNNDLLEILRDEPVICMTSPQCIGITNLFLTRESFGNGNALDDPIGKLPF